MSVLDAIYNRLSHEEEKKLFEAMLQSPTSFIIQHLRFVILRDPELHTSIRKE